MGFAVTNAIAANNSRQLWFLDLKNDGKVEKYTHTIQSPEHFLDDKYPCGSFDPTGQWFAALNTRGAIFCFDRKNLTSTIYREDSPWCHFHPKKNHTLLFHANYYRGSIEQGNIAEINVSTGVITKTGLRPATLFLPPGGAIAIAPDGLSMVKAGCKFPEIWNIQDYNRIGVICPLSASFTLAYSTTRAKYSADSSNIVLTYDDIDNQYKEFCSFFSKDTSGKFSSYDREQMSFKEIYPLDNSHGVIIRDSKDNWRLIVRNEVARDHNGAVYTEYERKETLIKENAHISTASPDGSVIAHLDDQHMLHFYHSRTGADINTIPVNFIEGKDITLSYLNNQDLLLHDNSNGVMHVVSRES